MTAKDCYELCILGYAIVTSIAIAIPGALLESYLAGDFKDIWKRRKESKLEHKFK